MVALGDESGMTDDPRTLPATQRLGSRCGAFPWMRFGPMWGSPMAAIPYAAKLTPVRPSVKRGRVSKSLF